MRTIIIILTIILLDSCCTKKKCADNYEPFISVKLKNFTSDEFLQSKLFSYDVMTKSLINTIELRNSNTSIGEFRVSSLEHKKEMREQFFVIQTPVSSDTIYNITYELYTYQIKCNSCFPTGPEKVTVTAFRNFSYYYKGQQYFNDTLTINK